MNALEVIAEKLILPTGKPYGKCWAAFQRSLFEAVFATVTDKKGKQTRPRFRLIYDERRRGESKTEDLAALALADLLTGPDWHRNYAVAADFDQAQLIIDAILGFKSRSPILEGLIVERSTVRNPITHAELRVISADDRTAYGIKPRRVLFDELSLQADERLWNAMWSAIGKNPASQMVAVSMAGWDFASLGWRIRELAHSSDDYYFASREGSELAPWLSVKDLEEQRATLHPADFARFWECTWTEPKGSWITREMFDAAAVGRESRNGTGGHYVGFVDIGLVHDPTAIAVCHRDAERVILDTLRTLQGSRNSPVELEAVEELVIDLTQRFGVTKWVFESPQAIASVQRLQNRLRNASVEARYPTADSMGRLFGNLYRLFADRKLTLYPHPQLRKEALGLAVKTVGGRLKVVESTSVHQDHVVALGGAAEMLEEDDIPMVQYFENGRWFGTGNPPEGTQETHVLYDEDMPAQTVLMPHEEREQLMEHLLAGKLSEADYNQRIAALEGVF